MNLTQFESQIRPEVPGCPLVVVQDAIVQACRQFAEDAGLLRDTLTLFSIVDTENYTLTPSNADNEIFAIYAVRRGDVLLNALAENPALRTDNKGRPFYYTYNNKQLQLIPRPQEVEEYTVEVMVRPIYQSIQTVDDRFGDYVDLISHWAKYRLMSMVNQPWTSPDGMMFNKMRYDALASDAKWYGWRANTRASISVKQRPFA
jgi:hypothetical protein